MQEWMQRWDRVNPEDIYRQLEFMALALERIADTLEKIAVSIDELKNKQR